MLFQAMVFTLGNGALIKGVRAGTYLSLAQASNILTYDLNRTVTDAIYEPVFDAISPIQKGINLGNGHWELKLASNLGEINTDNIFAADITGDTIYASVQVNTNIIDTNGAQQVTVNSDLTVNGSLVVLGSLSVPSVTPFHCAGLVSSTGTIIKSKGIYSFTVTKVGTGIYDITFGAAHPDGSNYVVTTDAYSDSAWGSYVDSHFQRTSSTVVRITTRTTSSTGGKIDSEFTFCVLA